MVIVVEGKPQEKTITITDEEIRSLVSEYINEGLSSKDAIKRVSEQTKINKNYVYINGKKYNIVVNYMDVTSVIIDENVKVGDKVEIFGDNISIREESRLVNANVYKTICSITNRVPRVYVYNDERKEIEY